MGIVALCANGVPSTGEPSENLEAAKNQLKLERSQRAKAICDSASGKLNPSLCSSPCASRPNVIVLYSPPNAGAGVEDRANIITTLGGYAEALCARLFVPKPCVMLGNHHVDGESLDCSLNWTSYFDLSKASGMVQDSMALVPGGISSKTITPPLLALKGSYELIDEDLAEALDCFQKSNPFFLTFNMGTIWYHLGSCGGRLRLELRQFGCTKFFKPYTTEEGSHKAEFAGIVGSPIAQRAAAEMISSFGSFSVLHLRRGDEKEKRGCDSSPEKVNAFLQCKLGHFNGSYPALFLFTDETDATYIKSILAIARGYSVRVSHGDALASIELAKAGLAHPDNYLIYSVSNLVKAAAHEKGGFVWKFKGPPCDKWSERCHNGNAGQPAAAANAPSLHSARKVTKLVSTSVPSADLVLPGCESWFLHNASCLPQCPPAETTAASIILIYEPGGGNGQGAGIGDRAFVVETMGTLAQALCARVVIPPPYMMLSAEHNVFGPVNCSYSWGRYWDVDSFFRPLVADGHAATVIEWAEYGGWSPYDGTCRRDGLSELESLKKKASVQYGLSPVSSLEEAFVRHREGVPFVLPVKAGYVYRSILPDEFCSKQIRAFREEPRCRSPRRSMSPSIRKVALAMIENVRPFAILHLRRGDTKALGCDNSPGKVRLMLNCVLGQYQGQFPGIYLFTDETDATYIDDVLAVARNFSVLVAHGDAAAAERFKALGVDGVATDNYLVYAVFETLKEQVRAMSAENCAKAQGGCRGPNPVLISMGGHGPRTREQCVKQTHCRRNGN